jgi:FKBP12-rapamycin complex-associated protein
MMVSPTLALPAHILVLTMVGTAEEAVDQINARALVVVERVQQKLTGSSPSPSSLSSPTDTMYTGRDFKPTVVLNVNDQVDKLIAQAMSLENLSQCFIGFCPFW